MATPPAAVRIEALVKRFGRTHALNGLDLNVEPGEVHGFLGPNGAGKSTTIRILLGLIRSGGGRVEVLGTDPWHRAASLHARLAYVPGDVALWPGLTGGQCLDALASLQGRPDPRRRAELIECFHLDPGVRIRDYSKGNRQKVALIAAFSARADLLILDEPTSGLDPLMEQVFQDCVRRSRQDGASVLLSSHILAEVEALADRVSIVRQGRTLLTDTLAELRRRARTTVRVLTEDHPRGLPGLARAGSIADLAQQDREGLVESRFSTDTDHLDDVLGRLREGRVRLLTVTPPSLDTLFQETYREAS